MEAQMLTRGKDGESRQQGKRSIQLEMMKQEDKSREEESKTR